MKSIEGIETPDLEYNTVYSEKYDEDLFNDKLLGKSKKEIIDKLGKPLRTEKVSPYLKFLYRDKNDSIYIDCSGGVDLSSYNITDKSYSFLTFEFDSKNNVKEVYEVRYAEKFDSDSLIGISKDDVIKKFGNPIQIAQINFDETIVSFSNIKDGAYTGKKPKIHIRSIVFAPNDIATKIIKTDGNPYNQSENLCKIINN